MSGPKTPSEKLAELIRLVDAVEIFEIGAHTVVEVRRSEIQDVKDFADSIREGKENVI